MAMSVSVYVDLDGETVGQAMADSGTEAADVIAAFSEQLEEQSEEFVEAIRDYAREPRAALALQALAGLILKGCEQ